jgi:hypothetical protein
MLKLWLMADGMYRGVNGDFHTNNTRIGGDE